MKRTGTNASFGLVVGVKWAETFGGNLDIHHRSKKMAYFIDYSVLRSHNLHTLDAQRKIKPNEFVQTVNDYSRRENFTTQQNLNMGVEWKIGPKTLVNVLLTGYSRNWEMKARATDVYNIKPDSSVTTEMAIQESNIWRSATGSIGFTTDINSKSKISASMDYLYYRNNNPSQYNVNILQQAVPPEGYLIDLEKSTPIHLYIAKLDYNFEVSQLLSFEAGAKAVLSSLHNDVLVQRGIGQCLDPRHNIYFQLKIEGTNSSRLFFNEMAYWKMANYSRAALRTYHHIHHHTNAQEIN